jgi:hypothetical protein
MTLLIDVLETSGQSSSVWRDGMLRAERERYEQEAPYAQQPSD